MTTAGKTFIARTGNQVRCVRPSFSTDPSRYEAHRAARNGDAADLRLVKIGGVMGRD
jgi:hypothetical protein